MITLSEINDKGQNLTIQWVQPGLFKPWYELRAGRYLLGKLRWRHFSFSEQALAEMGKDQWSFGYTQFVKPTVTIRRQNALLPESTFLINWRGKSELILPDGASYLWEKSDHWGCAWKFVEETTSRKGALPREICFTRQSGRLRKSVEVQFRPESGSIPDLTLLAPLGLYLFMLFERQAQSSSNPRLYVPA
jgi:hypothetical protein